MNGNIYASLMQPEGGSNRGNVQDNWGIIGMDIGLGMFGRRMMIGKSGIGGLYGSHRKQLSKRLTTGTAKYFTGGGRFDINTAEMISKTVSENLNRSTSAKMLKSQKVFSKLGNSLRGIGIAAAGIGLLDFGLSIGEMLAAPSASRDAISRDQKLFYDEMMTDSRLAYTQRQRAIQAIHDSQLSTGRALLGQESRYLHR